jgi:hypothetical protein
MSEHPELGGREPETWSAKVTIPATVEEAVADLTGLAQLLLAKEWHRAAIVYAFTRPGGRGPGADPDAATAESDSLSVPAFAALGLQGLNSHVTVTRYRRAWQWAMDQGAAEEARPGMAVDLPDLPWPKDEGGGSSTGDSAPSDERYTPAAFVDAARAVMGGIDLDPCSTGEANEVVKAAQFYTRAENGLALPWSGRVLLHPPHAEPALTGFCAKLGEAHAAGDVPMAVAVVDAETGAEWWQGLARWSGGLCLPSGKVRFWAPGGQFAPVGGYTSVLFLGPPEEAGKFSGEFSRFGITW